MYIMYILDKTYFNKYFLFLNILFSRKINIYIQVDYEMVKFYWEVERQIIKEEQRGKQRANKEKNEVLAIALVKKIFMHKNSKLEKYFLIYYFGCYFFSSFLSI